MKLTIYGAGVFGSSLGKILEQNGHEVLYYSPDGGISQQEAIDFPEVIILSVPSNVVNEVVKVLPKNKPLIVATKGLLSLKPFQDFKKVAFLSGGAFAAELDHHLKTTLTATDKLIPKLFKTSWLNFELTKDSFGVILCGALKNIYAIYAGYENAAVSPVKRADSISAVADEMKQILKLNGADPETVELACGIGDLKTTFTDSSRNYRFGRELHKNPNFVPSETTEGLSAFRHLYDSNLKTPKDLPILTKITQILAKEVPCH